jgi:serine/threonine-protein kinase
MMTAPPQARLIVLATGRVFPLTAWRTFVGRESPKLTRICGTGPDVVPLPDMHMSTQHAFIYNRQGTWSIEDNSAAGTSLNGFRLRSWQAYPLTDGDLLRFADTEVRFVVSF